MSIKNYHTYVDGNRRADVIKGNNDWGIEMFENGNFVKREFYKGKSEMYAENAAENYVLGIKN